MSLRMNVRLGFSIILKQQDIDVSIVDNLKFSSSKNLEELETIDRVIVQKYKNVRDYVMFLTKEQIKSLNDNEVMLHIIFSPGNHEWHRVSDNIDSYLVNEEDALNGVIKYINSNLYPFAENKICLNNFTELPMHISRQIFYKNNIDDELLSLGFNENMPLKEQFFMKAPLLVRNIARVRQTIVIYDIDKSFMVFGTLSSEPSKLNKPSSFQ